MKARQQIAQMGTGKSCSANDRALAEMLLQLDDLVVDWLVDVFFGRLLNSDPDAEWASHVGTLAEESACMTS